MTGRDPGAERDPEEGEAREAPRDDRPEPQPARDTPPETADSAPGTPDVPREPRREAALPADEEAAWAEIVAAYGDEPDLDPKEESGPTDKTGTEDKGDGSEPPEPDGDTLTKPREAPEAGTPVRSFTVYAAGTGPRDWEAPEDEDEGHFVPPEPPPLPETDPTTKFAWVAVLGGPLLMLGAIMLQIELTWWIITLGVGGFLGGFATLITRMRDGNDEDDWDDPGRGAVV